MLAPGDLLTVSPPAEPGRGLPQSAPGGAGNQLREPPVPGPSEERPPTFLEALRRMLASIHS